MSSWALELKLVFFAGFFRLRVGVRVRVRARDWIWVWIWDGLGSG